MTTSHTRNSRFREIWESFWIIPALFVIGALMLGVTMVVLGSTGPTLSLGILPGGASGIRSVLSSIVTAMISFTALVFSITIVALQLASSQFSPRVLRTFQGDRITQVALGTFVATFVYAMLVLASVPDPEDGSTARVPQLGTAVAMLFVLASIAVFILYIQHITTLVQVAHIIATIGQESRKMLDRLFPPDSAASSGAAQVPLGRPNQVVNAPNPGAVSDVAVDGLVRLAERHDCRIVLIPEVGQFVPAGAPLLAVHRMGDGRHEPVPDRELTQRVTLGQQRTLKYDLAFGFQQLADIAERALSPGYNDVTTAIQCINQVHDLLRRLVVRPLPDRTGQGADGMIRVMIQHGGIERFLAIGVDEIAYAGSQQPRVITRLTDMLDDLLAAAQPQHRAALAVRRHRLAGPRPAATPAF